MGYYLEVEGQTHGKANALAKEWDGRIESFPPSFDVLKQSNEVLVVVMDNGFFEAAGICFSSDEQEAFCNPSDSRPKKFLVLSIEKAIEAFSKYGSENSTKSLINFLHGYENL